MPSVSVAKIDDVRLRSPQSLEIMREAGVAMAYAAISWAAFTSTSPTSSSIRGRVLPSIDVIRSATSVAAELIGMPGEIGVIKPGAHADLIVVDGDPLADLALLTEQGRHLPVIIKAGEFIKNELNK